MDASLCCTAGVSMETCKTCKHWLFSGVEYGPERDLCAPVDPDTYEPMAMPFEVRACKHPALTFCERPVEANGFGVADGSEYMAILVTGPDFGCVRHEAAGT